MTNITVKSDGGSRGNPGPAAIGYVVYVNDKLIKEYKEYIGLGTNNEAEYKAIISALDWLQSNMDQIKKDDPVEIQCLLDSNLVVNQLNGNFKIKQSHLQLLANQAFQIIQKFKNKVSFKHIRREFNSEADSLLNQALDSVK